MTTQAQCTDMQERKLQLQQRLATLHSSGSAAAAAAPKEPNTLSADMQARQQDLDILLGLQVRPNLPGLRSYGLV